MTPPFCAVIDAHRRRIRVRVGRGASWVAMSPRLGRLLYARVEVAGRTGLVMRLRVWRCGRVVREALAPHSFFGGVFAVRRPS